MRARSFCDAVIPSSVALTHQAIRVTLLYEAAVKMRNLREPIAGQKRKYDREDTDVDEHYRLKVSRMNNFDRARDGDRNRDRRPRH